MYPYYKEGDDSENISVTLQNKTLWNDFSKHETEMIITKSGRRMFPSLRTQVEGLDPKAYYSIYLEFYPTSNKRYKYSNSQGWFPTGTGETQSNQRIYMHPESPSLGEHWMSQNVSFARVKLTNTAIPPPGQVVLSSMHKYRPYIIICKASHGRDISRSFKKVIHFEETDFFAVTAYQNQSITRLKIDNNPFAKGFRENGLGKSKRKKECDDDEVSVEKRQETHHLKEGSSSENSRESSPGTFPDEEEYIDVETPPLSNSVTPPAPVINTNEKPKTNDDYLPYNPHLQNKSGPNINYSFLQQQVTYPTVPTPYSYPPQWNPYLQPRYHHVPPIVPYTAAPEVFIRAPQGFHVPCPCLCNHPQDINSVLDNHPRFIPNFVQPTVPQHLPYNSGLSPNFQNLYISPPSFNRIVPEIEEIEAPTFTDFSIKKLISL